MSIDDTTVKVVATDSAVTALPAVIAVTLMCTSEYLSTVTTTAVPALSLSAL